MLDVRHGLVLGAIRENVVEQFVVRDSWYEIREPELPSFVKEGHAATQSRQGWLVVGSLDQS